MNQIKTLLCGNFIGFDKLERLKLLQSDPLVNEFTISIKEPETVSRFLGNFELQDHPNAEGNQFQTLQIAPEKEQAQIHHHRY